MSHRLLSVIATMLFLLAGEKVGAAAEPTPASIEKAVRELGVKDSRVRERAGELLRQAGSAAEAPLRRALSSEDPEVVSRAKAILARFDYGLYPDTPSNVVKVIEQYKAGSRQQAIDQFIEMGEPGIRALLAIHKATPEEDTRRLIGNTIADRTVDLAPDFLAQGKRDLAEAVLETGASTGMDACGRAHAAWLLFHGRLKTRIAQLKADPDPAPAVRRQLVHLYRADGDLPNAIECAARLSDPDLVRNLRREIGDWKALAEDPGAGDAEGIEGTGYKAAYYRLAGRRADFETALKAVQVCADRSLASEEAWHVAEAFLVNDRPQDALDCLIRGKWYELAFRLLVAQNRFEEAFGVVDRARQEKDDSLLSLEPAQARLLGLLGETNEARRIVARVLTNEAATVTLRSTADLVAAAASVDLTAEAAELAAATVGRIPSEMADKRCAILRCLLAGGKPEEGENRVEELSQDSGVQIAAWLAVLREASPQVKPAEHLVRLRGFFTGKPEALREFTALADRAAPAARKLTTTDQAAWWHSLADAHRRLGAFDRAVASERKACEAVESASNSMRLALALTAAGQWRKAAAAARQAAKLQPEPASFWVRGWALARAGDEKAGREDMELADLMALADVSRRHTLAQYMQTLGDVEAAARQREMIARLGDFDAWEIGESLPRLAERAARAGRFAAAATMWERSRLRCLDLDTAMSDIGGYLYVAVRARAAAALAAVAGGRIEEALDHIRVAREAAPQDIELAIALTTVLEKAGRKDAADELFGKTFEFQAARVRRFPRYSDGHSAIAWLAARTRRALPAGLEHARQAVELSPDAVRHQDTLAEVLFQLGRRDEAVAAMKSCVEQAPANLYFRRQLKRMQEGDPATDPSEPE